MAPPLQMSVAVHMFCSADSAHTGLYQQDSGSTINHMRTGKHLFAPQTSARDVVDNVLKSVDIGQKIHIMRILSHGNSGSMEFPWLQDEMLIAMEYQRFQYFFDPSARLELHGCGVASDTSIVRPGFNFRQPTLSGTVPGRFAGYTNGRGLKFLRRVAVVFGAQVVGAVNVQHVRANDWRYEGDTVTVSPNGKFHLDNALGRAYDPAAQEDAASAWLTQIDQDIRQSGVSTRARRALEDLIRTYPKTDAARWAKDRLGRPNLRMPELQADP